MTFHPNKHCFILKTDCTLYTLSTLCIPSLLMRLQMRLQMRFQYVPSGKPFAANPALKRFLTALRVLRFDVLPQRRRVGERHPAKPAFFPLFRAVRPQMDPQIVRLSKHLVADPALSQFPGSWLQRVCTLTPWQLTCVPMCFSMDFELRFGAKYPVASTAAKELKWTGFAMRLDG